MCKSASVRIDHKEKIDIENKPQKLVQLQKRFSQNDIWADSSVRQQCDELRCKEMSISSISIT